ncbi:MAG TPA: WYL domain-containing protein [Longimicrobiales bacterium]|nr:WYL domain-containing protein [Longimicrobiales bacterium]
MSPAHGTAADQLERILYILPAAHREGGILLDELAAALGVAREVVLSDIEDVTAREYYHPAGSTDTMSIRIERERVQVRAMGEFTRPTRLSAREALAVQLGLRSLAAECDGPRRPALLALAARIESALKTPEIATVHELREAGPARAQAERLPLALGRPGHREPEVEYDPNVDHALLVGIGDDVLRGMLSDAIGAERTVRMLYLKPGTQAPEWRRLVPLQLVYSDGYWYVLGFDLGRRAPRIFRLDRALDAELEEAEAPPEARDRTWIEHIAEQGPAPYFATDDVPARVRYSPLIGRWIAERTGAPRESDGSVLVTHRVASSEWLVRHVLQYGGEARVEQPEELRRSVARVAAQLSRG